MAVRKPETRARALALQLLYSWDSPEAGNGEGGMNDQVPLAEWGRVLGLRGAGPKIEERALALATDVVKHRADLDQRIERAADRWRIERLGVVDRNLLRLAAGELLAGATPPKVVIDEAIRLARWFGGGQSPSFVNGVLDRIARDAGVL